MIEGTMDDVPIGGRFWLNTGRGHRAADLVRGEYVRIGEVEYRTPSGAERAAHRSTDVAVYFDGAATLLGQL